MAVVRDVVRHDDDRQRPRLFERDGRSCCIGGSGGMSRGTAFAGFGILPKYRSTSCAACAASKSPTMVSVAFVGT